LLLSNIVVTHGSGPDGAGIERAASELRWLTEPERGKVEGVGFFEVTPEKEAVFRRMHSRSDQEFATVLRLFPSTAGRRLFEVRIPVIAGVLRQPQTALTERQVQLLASVRWQLQLLNDGAQWQHRFFRMTFTVKHAGNHAIVVANQLSCRDEHRKRAVLALDEIRAAIRVLRASGGSTA
jgi:hypothetical protein